MRYRLVACLSALLASACEPVATTCGEIVISSKRNVSKKSFVMRHFKSIALIAALSTAVHAQEIVGFDLEDFGKIVLSHPEFAGDEVPEAAFGDYNNEPISKYPNSVFARLGRSVGRLDVATDAGVFPCTAFLVTDDLIMTNHHCVPGILDHPKVNASAIVGVRFTTGYVIEGVEEGAASFLVNQIPVETNKDLDYTLLRVLGAKPGKEFGTMRLASAVPVEHSPYWIIGHPNGDAQRISREGCAAASPALSSRRLRHNCDTLPGNSGSPVIDAGTQQVIALHNAGSSAKQVNYAVPMSMILEHSTILKPHTPVVAKPDPEAAALLQLGQALALTKVQDKRAALDALISKHPNSGAAVIAKQILASLPLVVPQPSLPKRMVDDPLVQNCDRLAGVIDHPDQIDGAMLQPGVKFGDIDTDRAIPACQAAVRSYPKHPRLNAFLGRALHAAERYDEAIQAYKLAAAAGDIVAMNYLGSMSQNGLGVPQSYHEAVRWYRRAADRGNAFSQTNLGWMYESGLGVAQSDKSAADWYRKAAEQGYARAQTNLGWMFDKGRGVTQSNKFALLWYRKASKQGDARAQNNLGVMYEKGRGARQSYSIAAEWYRKSAEQGYLIAQSNLGLLFENGRGVEQSDSSAVFWYRKAAEQGYAKAQTNLGWMYRNGRGVAQSDRIAAEWYRKAADQDFPRAQNNLGWMYEKGKGVEISPTKAVELIVASLENGETTAVTRSAESWSPETAVQMQRVLKERGLYTGPIDGDIGKGTIAAMRKLLPN